MFAWLFARKRSKEMPQYSALQSIPTRELPSDLRKQEMSDFFTTQQKVWKLYLLEPARSPANDAPLFWALQSGGRGIVTLDLPDNGGQCFLIFSTLFRAGDYAQTQCGRLLPAGTPMGYLSTSPQGAIKMLRDMEGRGIRRFVLDRCPRCEFVMPVQCASLKTADDAVDLWAAFKATELTRRYLYLRYALDAARAGRLEIARDVALETVGHVTLAEPRLHLLLGQIGIGQRDRTLLREAGEFLAFLKAEAWSRKLEQTARTGSPNFADV
jgi:hypothetical protein